MKAVEFLTGVFAIFYPGDCVQLCHCFRKREMERAARVNVGHAQSARDNGRAMFSVDDCVSDCFLKWITPPYVSTRTGKVVNHSLKTTLSLAINWRRKMLRDCGKDLSFNVALCDRPSIPSDNRTDNEIVSQESAGEDKPLAERAAQAESEQAKQAPKYTANASPTMRDNARRMSGRILPKLGGQLLVDAKLDLGDNFPLLDAIRKGYTQTEIAEQLGVSQGTVSNRTKKIAQYFTS